MRGGDSMDDGETETTAVAFASSNERLLHAFQLTFGDAAAAFCYHEFNGVVTPTNLELNLQGTRMTHRIVEQVVEREHERRVVGLHFRQRFGHRQVQLDIPIAEELAEAEHDLLDHLLRLERFKGIDVGHLGHPRVREEVVDEASQPMGFLQRRNLRVDLAAVSDMIKKNDVATVIVGHPLLMSGIAGEKAKDAEAFADRLRAAAVCEVVLWDERLTTVQAQRALIEGNVRRSDRKHVVDAAAATLLLQSWLDARR